MSSKMHVRLIDENQTTLSLSKLRNIQKTNTPEVIWVKIPVNWNLNRGLKSKNNAYLTKF